jgi:hypothetical protein
LESQKLSILVGIVFIFVLGYTRVKGNEQADRLAGRAVFSDGCAIDFADVLHDLCKAEEWKTHL